MAMVTAEISAVVYYNSLAAATNSPLLKQICRQLLRDEAQHLQFQLEILGKLRQRRSPITNALMHLAHRMLFTGAVLIVGWQHASVLNSGGDFFLHVLLTTHRHLYTLFFFD